MNKSKRTPKEIRSAIIGTLLGDSYITQNSHFGCEQVCKALIERKAEILSHYSPDIKVSERQRNSVVIEGRKVASRPTYTIRLRHPRFKKWHKVLYKTGSKQVTYNILKFLNEEGIAMWIMDDGYMDYKKSSKTRNLRICTDSFDEISHLEMIRYFKDVWQIDAKIYWHKRNKNSPKVPRLSFNATNSQKLISLVYKHFVPELLYKLDLNYEDKTLNSIRCSDEYREAHKYISQSRAPAMGEDIV